MILCDTDVIISFLKGNSEIIKNLKNIGQQNISISSISIMEIYYGALNKQELNILKKILNPINQVYLTKEVTEKSVELIESYSKSHGLEIPDSLIASSAIVNKIPLYTLNKKDFKFITGLNLF